MKNVNIVVVLLCLVFLSAGEAASAASKKNNNDNEYAISKIPISLLKDADAIVRQKTIRFEIKNEKRAIEKVKKAVTIFKKDERGFGKINLPYDKFDEIEELEGRIYDADGNEVAELNSNQIQDYSAYDNFSLYADNRMKTAELYYDRYPYTVEFTYEYSYDGYLNWPTWYSRMSTDAVESCRFEVVVPEDGQLRYWCNQDSVKPSILQEGSKKVYVWESKNLPKLSKDAIGDDIEDVATIVRIAPIKFEIDGYKGSMQSWKDFGLWVKELYNNRDQLPESAIKDIHSLLTPQDNTYEKIKKLYNYMQSRTRYVSVQLGIGGYQPFDAKYVHDKGYGDCKALSNYMVAILKEAGIKSHPVLIKSGSYRLPIVKDFPSNQFNHAIAVIPLEKDTIWLECTSQTSPLGQIGWDNENRSALMITEQGGVLVETPKSQSRQNAQIRFAKVSLKSVGEADADVIVRWSGNQQNNVRYSIDEASPEEKEQWILNSLDVPEARLHSFKLEGIEAKNAEGSLALQLNLPNIISVSGNRLFFQPNLMEKRTYVPPDIAQRLSPVRFSYPYYDSDSIYYLIPKGFTVETIPQEVKLKSSFAEFSSKTVALGDSVMIFMRNLDVKDYSIPAKNYSEYRKFFTDVVKADRAQAVLVRKNY